MPTTVGDVLVLWTKASFTLHVVGRITEDAQQDFHRARSTRHVHSRVRALAAAKALRVQGQRIFFRNLDTHYWSERTTEWSAGADLTVTQWAVELATVLQGTDWTAQWSGVTRLYPSLVADLYHAVTHAYQDIDVSWHDCRTRITRAAEIVRQLPLA
jgi:hypothetical protein